LVIGRDGVVTDYILIDALRCAYDPDGRRGDACHGSGATNELGRLLCASPCHPLSPLLVIAIGSFRRWDPPLSYGGVVLEALD
ncbi:hypothetical protein BHE74_00033869, partial [Ensete ventricosum]